MKKKLFYTFISSPAGSLAGACIEKNLLERIILPRGSAEKMVSMLQKDFPDRQLIRKDTLFSELKQQIREYFSGTTKVFSLPYVINSTRFTVNVLEAVSHIPFGETKSYKEIAEAAGCPGAYRAVGGANNRNPLPLIIPCHRVIGSDGSLTGFGGGVKLKECLLEWEKEILHVEKNSSDRCSNFNWRRCLDRDY